MMIKKFQGATEQEAILKAKEDMGSAAVVLNIKTIKHRGLGRLFKKDVVEVTAAVEERKITSQIPTAAVNQAISQSQVIHTDLEPVKNTSAIIEEKLDNIQAMFESQMKKEKEAVHAPKQEVKEEKPKEKNVNFAFIQLIYNQLLNNEVDEKYVNQIIGEIETSIKKESNVDSILSSIYQKIILKLGQPKLIEVEDGKTKLVFFVGPTGVGKTTTIAKLASYYRLEKKVKVGLITADTYRIAAVEQLRTYANILDVPLQVVYTIDEFEEAVKNFEGYDVVFVDTAGRSHKNDEQCKEVIHMINDAKLPADVEKNIYLVLSAATKYKDLISISDVFGEIKDYSIIFTKLDETLCLGNILNLKLKTGASLSYVASGQAVPEDIGSIDGQRIARSLLGGSE